MTSPVTSNTKVQSFRVGIHTGADVETEPSTLTYIQPRSLPSTTDTVEYLERNLQAGDNQKFHSIVGTKMPEVLTGTVIEAAGLATVAGDGVTASMTGHELEHFLAFLAGAAPVLTTGGGLVSDSEATPSVTVGAGEGAGFADDTFVMFGKNMRMIESIQGDTLTLDRGAWTDTPTGDVYASATYKIDPAINDPNGHLYFVAEGETWQRKLFGCAIAGATITAGEGQILEVSIGNVMANDWQSGTPDASFSAPANGTTIVTQESPLYINGTKYDARNVSVEFGLDVKTKASTCGVNGRNGFFIGDRTVTISASLYYNEALKALAETDATQDVLLQIGFVAGRAIAVRIPSAEFRAARGDIDGMEMLTCTFMATRDGKGITFVGIS